MRRHVQSRGARVQTPCPFLCQRLGTARAVIFLLEQNTHLHSQQAACRVHSPPQGCTCYSLGLHDGDGINE